MEKQNNKTYSSILRTCGASPLADEAVRTLIRLVQPQLQETVATTELGRGLALHGAVSHG